MWFDFWKVGSIHEKEDWILDPVQIFYNSDHPEIKDLFPTQKDILDEWYKNYNNGIKDNLIQLDTWAWKTLIWLLIAESIRKSKKWKILYLCPDNFLIEQVADKASKYWINTSTYYGWNWENEIEFLWNNSICITNYHSVFFNNSKFKDLDIVWVIFDDSHTAINILDEKYSVQINNNDFLKNVLNLFWKYKYIKSTIEDIKTWNPHANIMIPPVIWWNNVDHVKKMIEDEMENLKDSISFN